jgi:chloramphenicol O-acetyltransferase type B
MKAFFDSTIFANPLYEYFKWIVMKIRYQTKYWGNHLRIGYNAYVRSTVFGKYNYIEKNVTLIDCAIGDYSYVSAGSIITNSTIGKFCSIGPNVQCAPGKHPTSIFVSTHPVTFSNPSFMKKSFTTQTMYEGNIKVTIGNDVWIGANCVILDGVVVEDGAIIAANSVVTKNVGAYCIVGGSPAKLLKKRFDEEDIDKLLGIKWWDKSEQWIQDNIATFWDIKNFTGK